MVGPSLSTTQRLGRAIVASVAPKTVGSSFRVKDDWHAPHDIKRDTILREGFTLAQISAYSILIDRAVKLLEKSAEVYIRKNPKTIVKTGLAKFRSSQVLFTIGLSCASNFMAEACSRKLAPRDIWDKENMEKIKDAKREEDDDYDDGDVKPPSRPSDSEKRDFKTQPAYRQQPVFSCQPDFRQVAYAMNSFTNTAYNTVMR